jgi:hypothetical protein
LNAPDTYRARHKHEFIASSVTALRDAPTSMIREFLVQAARPRDGAEGFFLVSVGSIQRWRPPHDDLQCAQPYVVDETRDLKIDEGYAADLRRRFATETR